MNRKGYLAPAVAMLLVFLVPGVNRATDRATPTVGDFLARVAVLASQQQRGESSDAARVFELTAGLDRSEPLTYGGISRIAADLGVSVTPHAVPTAPVSAERASTIAGLLASSFAVGGVATPGEPPNECLSSDNRGVCVDCCKAATGLTGQYCGRFCHANVSPPPSPGEPAP